MFSTRLLSLYANKPINRVPMRHLLQNLSLLESARFLQSELPVRLAKRVFELQQLPYGLSEQASVKEVIQWYRQSFKEMIEAQVPVSAQQEAAFSLTLQNMVARHANVVPMIAQGILQLKNDMGDFLTLDCPFLQNFLDRFYSQRMGIRLLIFNHIDKHSNNNVRVYDESCCPFNVALDAIEDATIICQKQYMLAPEVQLLGAGKDLHISAFPTHIHHILLELLKNSMRAVVETHSDSELPPIEIVIAEGEKEVTIKVSDRGGGIPSSRMDHIWTYLYSTAASEPELTLNYQGINRAPMAGLGYGLPLSRVFARFSGGDLDLISMDGLGTDCYLFVPKDVSSILI